MVLSIQESRKAQRRSNFSRDARCLSLTKVAGRNKKQRALSVLLSHRHRAAFASTDLPKLFRFKTRLRRHVFD